MNGLTGSKNTSSRPKMGSKMGKGVGVKGKTKGLVRIDTMLRRRGR